MFSFFNRISSLAVVLFLAASGCSWRPSSNVSQPISKASPGTVATVHPLADQAAENAFRKGGNAIDAAVAAGLSLGVVDGFNSGIGGGCFILIRLANGEVVAIDGRETAPASATRDMFIRNGKAVPELSQTGALAVGVPGALAAYARAVEDYGNLNLQELILPAAELARSGFEIDTSYHERASSVAEALTEFPETARIFLNGDHQAWSAGHVLVQSDLSRTYHSIGREGIGWFYEGPFATRLTHWMNRNGGLVGTNDLAQYRPRIRQPVRTTYRGFEILGFPPPSSGGVHVAQILNILEEFDLTAMGFHSPDFIHVVAEAMKLAFADRAWWLGDPDFAAIPRGLIDKSYARELAKRIQMDRVIEVDRHSLPPRAETDLFGSHTTHFATADEKGNWVAITATINTTYGSKVVVPGTGVVLNNEMDDFAAQPGQPNFFGLIGNEANAVEPGKRPLSSMSPTIVLKNGEPVFSTGAAGGPTIISQSVLAVIAHVDFEMTPEEILAQPRFHHQWLPDELMIESSFDPAIREELQKRGHQFGIVDSIGASQSISRTAQGKWLAGRDPRLSR